MSLFFMLNPKSSGEVVTTGGHFIPGMAGPQIILSKEEKERRLKKSKEEFIKASKKIPKQAFKKINEAKTEIEEDIKEIISPENVLQFEQSLIPLLDFSKYEKTLKEIEQRIEMFQQMKQYENEARILKIAEEGEKIAQYQIQKLLEARQEMEEDEALLIMLLQ